MATEKEEIYGSFLQKITDYELPLLDSDMQAEILNGYLSSAIKRSWRILKNIDFNKGDEEQFTDNFGFDEMDILTEWMVVFWLDPYVNNGENLRLHLNTKDQSTISPANLLEKMSNRYEKSRSHANSLMNKYSFINSDLERLKP